MLENIASLNIPLPEDVQKAKDFGDFDKANRLIDLYLNDAFTAECMKQRLITEKEVLRRLPLAYPYDEESALKLIQEEIPDFTMEELHHYEDIKGADWIYINGQVHLQDRFFASLQKVYPEVEARCHTHSEKNTLLLDNMKEMKEKGQASYHMTVKAGIKIADKAFVPGKKVLVHLPIPAECASISNVEILDHTDLPCHIADKNSLSRTISFETVLEENRDFFVKYSYDCTAKYTALDYNAPSSIDSNETVEEMAPQIVFTPYIKKLCAELSEGIEDPLHKARAFYKYCTENVTYAFMREYMTLGNICEYAAAQRIGDCGVKALLFITLCRCAGIPAHWQSGLYVTPDFIGNHDWSMFKIEPYGWLYADPSFGGSAFRNKDFERQEFYFGNLDPFRMVANNELQQEFDPPKKQWRRDPYDNQSGEIEYEDRGLIHDEVETEMVILSAEKI